jgi:hypothetical protein
MSWHPNTYTTNISPSMHDTSFYLDNGTVYQPSTFYDATTTSAYGQYTPLTQPVLDEPQIHELITPLESLSAQEFNNHGFDMPAYIDQQYWLPQQNHATMDAMFPPNLNNNFNNIPTYHPQPYHPQQATFFSQDLPTAPSSPNFLPIQGGNIDIEASPLDLNTKAPEPPISSKSDANGGEELVAMGLYDSPADVQSSSLLFGSGGGLGLRGGLLERRRSLKLEEAFEPPAESKEQDQGSQGDELESGEEDDEVEEPLSEPDDFETAGEGTYQVYQQNNLVGQSFLFAPDEKEAATTTVLEQREHNSGIFYPNYVMAQQGLPMSGGGYGYF